MIIKEKCVCGASAEVESTNEYCKAYIESWRRRHKHIPPAIRHDWTDFKPVPYVPTVTYTSTSTAAQHQGTSSSTTEGDRNGSESD